MPASDLIHCADLRALAAELVERAARASGGEARLVWWQGQETGGDVYPDHVPLAPAGLERARAVVAIGSPGGGYAWTGSATVPLVSPGLAALGVGAALLLDRLPRPLEAALADVWVREWRPYVDNALEKARLGHSLARLEKSERVQKALFEISELSGSGMDMTTMLGALHAIVGGLMYAKNFFITIYDAQADSVRFIYFADIAEEEWQSPDVQEEALESIRHSLTWHLIKGGRPLRGPTRELQAQVSGPLEIIGPHSADWLGVPMLSAGRVRGVIVVQHYSQWPCYSQEDEALLSFVGSHILTALDRKRAVDELEQEVARRTLALRVEVQERERGERLQAALYRIAELSHGAGGLPEFCASVHAVVGEFIDSRNFYIALLDDTGRQLSFPYFVDTESPVAPPPRPPARSITDLVLRTGQPFLADATTRAGNEELARLHAAGELSGQPGLSQSWLGVPLVCADRPVGVLAVQTYVAGACYSHRDQELLIFISHQIAHGLERKRAASALLSAHADLERRVAERTRELSAEISVRQQIELRLKHEVLHDSLTGLPNRAYLREQLGRALARQRRDPAARFAILFMDLDRFKVINDSAGHMVGDALLEEVARRFSTCARGPDMVARLGGDEFAILMENLAGDDAPVRLAQRLIDALRRPVPIGGKEIFTSVSVGIVVSHPRYHEADELLRDADIAMYRAKAGGRERFEVFDETLHREALGLLQLEGELRHAIAHDQFHPWFQPIVQLRDGAVEGYEALLRWQHPVRGWLAPGEFLRVADAGGLLESIDWRMYAATCRCIPRLLRAGQYVNINVSPRHLLTADFDVRLLQLLEEHGVAPDQLRVEVTEGALVECPQRASRMLDRLSRAGILTALDDFGTGYSSLGYLHTFRLDTLKIDRSFVEDLLPGQGGKPSTAVASAILTLSRAFGLQVVAEGIESEAQRAALMELGCRLGQGYLFARPLELEAAIAARAPDPGA